MNVVGQRHRARAEDLERVEVERERLARVLAAGVPAERALVPGADVDDLRADLTGQVAEHLERLEQAEADEGVAELAAVVRHHRERHRELAVATARDLRDQVVAEQLARDVRRDVLGLAVADVDLLLDPADRDDAAGPVARAVISRNSTRSGDVVLKSPESSGGSAMSDSAGGVGGCLRASSSAVRHAVGSRLRRLPLAEIVERAHRRIVALAGGVGQPPGRWACACAPGSAA